MDLIEKYLPIFVFHPNETVHPVSIYDYLQKSSLIDVTKKKCSCINLNLSWNIDKYINCIQKKYNIVVPRGNYNDIIKPENYNQPNLSFLYTGPLSNTLVKSSPVYTYTHTKGNIISLYYWLFYPNQNPYSLDLCGKPFYLGGQHTADIETVQFDYNLDTKKIETAYYYRHGTPTELKFDDIEWKNNRPVVYVSLHSHASYHLNGVNFRFLGLLNDYTVPILEGQLWKPDSTNIKSLNHSNGSDLDTFILHYNGNMGFNSISSFANRIKKIKQL